MIRRRWQTDAPLHVRAANWWNGWRLDFEDWWVRARRASDPEGLPSDVGFVEEACVAVRTPLQARALDKGQDPARAFR